MKLARELGPRWLGWFSINLAVSLAAFKQMQSSADNTELKGQKLCFCIVFAPSILTTCIR